MPDRSDEPANGGRVSQVDEKQAAVGFRLSWCNSGVDTTQPNAKLTVIWWWWEPKPPHGRCDGDWRKWTDERRRQHESEVERREVAMLNLQFTRAEPLVGGHGVRRLLPQSTMTYLAPAYALSAGVGVASVDHERRP